MKTEREGSAREVGEGENGERGKSGHSTKERGKEQMERGDEIGQRE